MAPSQKQLGHGRKILRRTAKSIMRSQHCPLPRYDLPIRLRPWFMVFTCIVMVVLAFLGYSSPLPLNDKLQHFLCFSIATGIFYFIFDVDEDARRIWFWRYSGLIATGVVCFFFGGVVSEFVQSMLPYREFHFGDVLANLSGSTIGLTVSYHLERYYRHRREISRLYQPLDGSPDPESDPEDAQLLLPLHNLNDPLHANARGAKSGVTAGPGRVGLGLGDVWDEREELFGIGDSDDEEGGGVGDGPGRVVGLARGSVRESGSSPLPPPPPPKILVTSA